MPSICYNHTQPLGKPSYSSPLLSYWSWTQELCQILHFFCSFMQPYCFEKANTTSCWDIPAEKKSHKNCRLVMRGPNYSIFCFWWCQASPSPSLPVGAWFILMARWFSWIHPAQEKTSLKEHHPFQQLPVGEFSHQGFKEIGTKLFPTAVKKTKHLHFLK